MTVTCERCRVVVPVASVAKPGRCVDWRCPLNSAEENRQLAELNKSKEST